MRISMVLPAFRGSGGVLVFFRYARLLGEMGHDVCVYAPLKAYNMHRSGTVADRAKQVYATAKVVSWKLQGEEKQIREKYGISVRYVPQITDHYLSNADVVVASAWPTAYDVARLGAAKGAKFYFIQGYEDWDNDVLGRKSYQLPLQRIVIADWIGKRIQTECGVQEHIDVVHNGVDTALYRNPDKKVGKRHIRCLLLYHDLPKKGTREGIAAFERALVQVPDMELILFGLKRPKNRNLPYRFCENLSERQLARLYCKMDIFLFPSLEEGWGLTPVEAMACGCAVAGSRAGCMLDIGRHGENVLLSEPGDVEGMAENICQLAQDVSLRERIGAEGIRTAQRLDWKESARKLEQIFQKAANDVG